MDFKIFFKSICFVISTIIFFLIWAIFIIRKVKNLLRIDAKSKGVSNYFRVQLYPTSIEYQTLQKNGSDLSHCLLWLAAYFPGSNSLGRNPISRPKKSNNIRLVTHLTFWVECFICSSIENEWFLKRTV